MKEGMKEVGFTVYIVPYSKIGLLQGKTLLWRLWRRGKA